MTLFSLTFSLFLLMDSLGNIPIFLALLKELNPHRQRIIIFRELVIALIVIVAFYFIGDVLLSFLGISQPAVSLSGGIILFIIGLKLMFPSDKNGTTLVQGEKEPFLVPLAIPLVAGPATLAAVMLYSHQPEGTFVVLGAIFIAWAASTAVLLCSIPLKKVLGARGLAACERLTGLLLIMISVQMAFNSIQSFLQP